MIGGGKQTHVAHGHNCVNLQKCMSLNASSRLLYAYGGML
jgi:hypothetical protein